MFGQRLLKVQDWSRTVKKIIDTKEISEADFSSRNYISAEKKPLGSSFEEEKYKG